MQLAIRSLLYAILTAKCIRSNEYNENSLGVYTINLNGNLDSVYFLLIADLFGVNIVTEKL